jgi:hypothetical protein
MAAALGASLALAGPGCFLLGAAQPAVAPAVASSAAPASPAPTATTPEVNIAPPEVDIAPPQPGLPDLRRSIGGRDEGGTAPTALQALTRTMTPDDVDALFPGAKRVSKYGISSVKAKDLPGVDHIEFGFQNGKLYRATLNYRRNLVTAAFAAYFRRVVANKYGESKDDIMTYVLSNGVLVQASKFVDHYQLSYTPPDR